MAFRPGPKPAALAAALCLHGTTHAINGAQLGGNGIRNAAMGGTSIALPLDANAAANNPAGMAFVPSSAALDLQVFRGHSTAEYVLPGNHLDNKQTIPAPQGGINWQLSQTLAVGFSLAGSGSGSDYGDPALPVAGAGNAKSTLRIAELIPTVAWKPREDLAFGFGLTIAYERFKADGVIVPAPVPGGLLPLPGHGTQSATGIGWRAGLLWKPRRRLDARRELQGAHRHGPARRLRHRSAGLQRRQARRAGAVRRRGRVAGDATPDHCRRLAAHPVG